MPKLSPVSARKLIRLLKKQGFEEIRQKGSHVRFSHPDGRKTTIPLHSGEKVGIGLLISILKDVDISREDYLKNI